MDFRELLDEQICDLPFKAPEDFDNGHDFMVFVIDQLRSLFVKYEINKIENDLYLKEQIKKEVASEVRLSFLKERFLHLVQEEKEMDAEKKMEGSRHAKSGASRFASATSVFEAPSSIQWEPKNKREFTEWKLEIEERMRSKNGI
jgi:hypothetical protein